MSEAELKAIEARLLGERKPIDVGDVVDIEDYMFNVHAGGTVTKRDGEAIWLDDKPAQYWRVDAHRREPRYKEDIAALIAEVRQLQGKIDNAVAHLVREYEGEGLYGEDFENHLIGKIQQASEILKDSA